VSIKNKRSSYKYYNARTYGQQPSCTLCSLSVRCAASVQISSVQFSSVQFASVQLSSVQLASVYAVQPPCNLPPCNLPPCTLCNLRVRCATSVYALSQPGAVQRYRFTLSSATRFICQGLHEARLAVPSRRRSPTESHKLARSPRESLSRFSIALVTLRSDAGSDPATKASYPATKASDPAANSLDPATKASDLRSAKAVSTVS